jgi:hypothetical protein
VKIIPLIVPSSFELVLFGDTHHGSTLCHEHGIDALMAWTLADKNRFLIHMGDVVEAIMTDDKRYQHDVETMAVPLQQRDYVVERYKPVAHRLKVALVGNHEFKLWRFGNLSEDICERLSTKKHKVEYGTYVSVVRLYDKKGYLFSLYLGHGWKSLTSNAKDWEQRQANMKAALKMQLKFKAADCLVQAVGHSHKLLVVPPSDGQLYLTHEQGKAKAHYLDRDEAPGGGYIHPDQRWYCNTGSYMKLYGDEATSGYAERRGYDPIELGHIVVTVRDRKLVDCSKVIA